jgi:hypothetical protein
MPIFRFDNSFVRDLPVACVACRPLPVPAPALLYLNRALAVELGVDPQALDARCCWANWSTRRADAATSP